jgi:hypothetical protein
VSDSPDPRRHEAESDPFEHEPFEAERVADDPIGAFADESRVSSDEDPEPAEATALSEVDVDPELRVVFWKLVLLYKITIIGATLGVLLLVFEKGPDVGPELLAGALALLGYTLYATKRSKKRIDSGEFENNGSDGAGGGEDTAGGDGAGGTATAADGGEVAVGATDDRTATDTQEGET